MDQNTFLKQAEQVWQQMSKAPLQRIISRLLPDIEQYLRETGITLDVLTQDLSQAGFRTRQGEMLKEGTVRATLSRARRALRMERRSTARTVPIPLSITPKAEVNQQRGQMDRAVFSPSLDSATEIPLSSSSLKPGSLEYERMKVQKHRLTEQEKQRKEEERQSIFETERQKRLDAVKKRRLKRKL